MNQSNTSIAVIITSAGKSSRFNAGKKKEYLPLASTIIKNQPYGTVLSCSLEPFLQFFQHNTQFFLKHLVITVPNDNFENECIKALHAINESLYVRDMFELLQITPEFVAGNDTRQKSVYNALLHINPTGTQLPDIDLVLIHDAARPFLSAEIVNSVVHKCKEKGSAVPIVEPVDTQKEIDSQGKIIRHLTRSDLGAVQTPQGFDFNKLFTAHTLASADNKNYTDDTEIWAQYCNSVYTVPGSNKNIKITFMQDLQTNTPSTQFRTGLGTDLHKLEEGRKFFLGGLEIPFEKGAVAHSDGDVLLHAITDSLLGAAGLGDIGELFPPTDLTWKDADSKELLKSAWSKIKNDGWKIENIDCVLHMEKPKFLPWREKVIISISDILKCDSNRVFVKAKTGEGLGDVGNGNAISAQVICLLSK